MHWIVNDLLPILRLVQNFSTDRDIVPALKCLYFCKDELRATSGPYGIIYYLPQGFDDPSPIIVPADLLVKVVGSLHQQGIETVDLLRERNSVLVKGGGVSVTLQGGSAPDFPLVDLPDKTQGVHVYSESFWKAMKTIKFSVSQDLTSPQLCGYFWNAHSKHPRMAASDRYRLSYFWLDESPPEGSSVLIPYSLINSVGFDDTEDSVIVTTSNKVWMFLKSSVVYGTLYETPFPEKGFDGAVADAQKEYESRKMEGSTVVVDPNYPIDLSIERVLLFADKFSSRVRVILEKDCIKLTSGENHSVVETVPATIEGPGGSFIVHGRFFGEALQISRRFFFLPGNIPLYFISSDRLCHHILWHYAN